VYWNFPGSPPSWLSNGAFVEVSGEYQHYNTTYRGPEIIATHAFPIAQRSPSEKPPAAPNAWAIIPWGAAGEVAGSCYQLTTSTSTILVDCGSHMNWDDMPCDVRSPTLDCDPFPFDPRGIDALIVTHAHDDHTARIHYLVAQGFRGEIHMTEATAKLYHAELDDTLYYSYLPDVREKDRRASIMGSIENLIVEHRYLETFEVARGISATFVDAGHIPGSSSVVLRIETPGQGETLAFSGDIGSGRHPFLNPPDTRALSSTGTSTLIVESTYGSSEPRDYPEDPYGKFYSEVQAALDNEKLVVVPTFALDRTQRVLAALIAGVRTGRLFLEKPIGVGGKSSRYLTESYLAMQSNTSQCGQFFSAEYCSSNWFASAAWEFIRRTPEDASRETPEHAWDYDVVVTPSGTGSSSYAKELIEAYAEDDRVVFIQVGWVPSWSPLGKLAGTDHVVDVRDAFSGHADIDGLVAYIRSFPDLERVIITHGDDALVARQGLAAEIRKVLPDVQIVLPEYGQEIPLIE
jgi:Cft2 family RNA processing exonuclease